jgi:hypothetical protein
VRNLGSTRISIDRAGDDLVVTIAGSRVEGPERLGMADRVEAAGGELTESGNRLTIRLPGAPAAASRPATPAAGARG